MSDTQEAMREFRFLDEKRKTGGLAPGEEQRWFELCSLLGIPDPAQGGGQAQGYYADDGNWYPYPEGYDPGQAAQQGYDSQGNPYSNAPQGYAPQGYGPGGYPPQGYDPNAYGYPQQQGYDPNQYPQQGYDPNGYPQQAYDPNGYPQQGYDPAAQGYSGYPPAPGYPHPGGGQPTDPNPGYYPQQSYDAYGNPVDPNLTGQPYGYASPPGYAGYPPAQPQQAYPPQNYYPEQPPEHGPQTEEEQLPGLNEQSVAPTYAPNPPMQWPHVVVPRPPTEPPPTSFEPLPELEAEEVLEVEDSMLMEPTQETVLPPEVLLELAPQPTPIPAEEDPGEPATAEAGTHSPLADSDTPGETRTASFEEDTSPPTGSAPASRSRRPSVGDIDLEGNPEDVVQLAQASDFLDSAKEAETPSSRHLPMDLPDGDDAIELATNADFIAAPELVSTGEPWKPDPDVEGESPSEPLPTEPVERVSSEEAWSEAPHEPSTARDEAAIAAANVATPEDPAWSEKMENTSKWNDLSVPSAEAASTPWEKPAEATRSWTDPSKISPLPLDVESGWNGGDDETLPLDESEVSEGSPDQGSSPGTQSAGEPDAQPLIDSEETSEWVDPAVDDLKPELSSQPAEEEGSSDWADPARTAPLEFAPEPVREAEGRVPEAEASADWSAPVEEAIASAPEAADPSSDADSLRSEAEVAPDWYAPAVEAIASAPEESAPSWEAASSIPEAEVSPDWSAPVEASTASAPEEPTPSWDDASSLPEAEVSPDWNAPVEASALSAPEEPASSWVDASSLPEAEVSPDWNAPVEASTASTPEEPAPSWDAAPLSAPSEATSDCRAPPAAEPKSKWGALTENELPEVEIASEWNEVPSSSEAPLAADSAASDEAPAEVEGGWNEPPADPSPEWTDLPPPVASPSALGEAEPLSSETSIPAIELAPEWTDPDPTQAHPVKIPGFWSSQPMPSAAEPPALDWSDSAAPPSEEPAGTPVLPAQEIEEGEIELSEAEVDIDLTSAEVEAPIEELEAPSAPTPMAPRAGPGTLSAPALQPPVAELGHPGFEISDSAGLTTAFVDGEHRVIVHTIDGQVKRGVVRNLFLMDEYLRLESQAGAEPERIPSAKVKAVFFMLTAGTKQPPNVGDKIRVTFNDGRQVTGFSNDHHLPDPGFFLIPADNRTNTARIYIYRASVQVITPG